MNIILDRITKAFWQIPSDRDWLIIAILLLVYGFVAIFIGIKWRFIIIESQLSLPKILSVATVAFVAPALLEELFFRVVLIPHPTENIVNAKLWFYIILSLFLFVIYHPLNVFVRHNTFKDFVFLLLATLLGITCTIAYLKTGSLWSPVIIHWIVVVVWILCLGGDRKIHNQLK
jgi:predicted Abi (CAAX) family protease